MVKKQPPSERNGESFAVVLSNGAVMKSLTGRSENSVTIVKILPTLSERRNRFRIKIVVY